MVTIYKYIYEYNIFKDKIYGRNTHNTTHIQHNARVFGFQLSFFFLRLTIPNQRATTTNKSVYKYIYI